MDAKEIREYQLCDEGNVPRSEVFALCDIATMLREVAAQLAELNSNLRVQTAMKDFDPRFSE